jgi:hypothetical protein
MKFKVGDRVKSTFSKTKERRETVVGYRLAGVHFDVMFVKFDNFHDGITEWEMVDLCVLF